MGQLLVPLVLRSQGTPACSGNEFPPQPQPSSTRAGYSRCHPLLHICERALPSVDVAWFARPFCSLGFARLLSNAGFARLIFNLWFESPSVRLGCASLLFCRVCASLLCSRICMSLLFSRVCTSLLCIRVCGSLHLAFHLAGRRTAIFEQT